MSTYYSSIKELANHIKYMKQAGNSTALLIGAGVSYTAGVPLANEMVAELIEKYDGYNLSQYKEKSSAYNDVMRSLTHNQRESFLREKIQNAKINLAHLFIGSLVANEFIDCVLTTNFDPLLVKTLALNNIYPSIYDLANTKKFLPNSISYPNIFYLHGQGTAFRMLNTEEETKESIEYFSRLFDHLDKKHSWIVIGYSGENDFIFKGLKSQTDFYNNLYWIGRKNEPPIHVLEDMCCKDSVRYIQSQGSDVFFRDLNNELKLPLPNFVEKPFSHLKQMLQNIGELKYEQETISVKAGLLDQTYLKIDNAIESIEDSKPKALTDNQIKKIEGGEFEQKINELYTLGRYQEIIQKGNEIRSVSNNVLLNALSWSYVVEADRLIGIEELQKAEDYYNEALKINPDFYDAYYNWGTSLGKLAKLKNNDEKLFLQAFDKFSKAVSIKSSYSVWYNWGTYLAFYAKSKEDDLEIYPQSFEKFKKATEIDPGQYDAWFNWGTNLGNQFLRNSKDTTLLKEALEKLKKATEIDPNRYDAWVNLAYFTEVSSKDSADELKLATEANEIYHKASKVAPPDKFIFLNAWGVNFLHIAVLKNNNSKLLEEASEKFKLANNHSPYYSSYNLACVYSLKKDIKNALMYLEESLKNNTTRVTRAHIENDKDLTNIKVFPEFKSLLDKYMPN